ncbi:MAG: YkgJ family cysteine cluster protein [Blastocatellia bacterium]
MNHTQADTAKTETQAAPDKLVHLTRKRGMSEADFVEMIEHLGQRRAQALTTDEEVGLYAETLAESVLTDSQLIAPDCQRCGACCAFFHQVIVLDSDPTPRRLTWAVWDDGAIAEPKTHWLRRDALEGRCVAFSGRVGQYAQCAIYELRPASCRAFEAGSDRCRAVRRAYGIEPPLLQDERIEHARRIKPDAGGEWNQVEALERRDPLSFSERERAKLLAEMIAYHCAQLAEISTEAERLHFLLTEKGMASPAESAARYVSVINEEARAVASALKPLPSIERVEVNDEVEMEKLNRDLLDVAAQSQAALNRATRWLAALGESVFDAFKMRIELASSVSINKSSEAER